MKDVVIIGQSHTVCMSEAADESAAWDKISIYYPRDKMQKANAVDLVQSLSDDANLFLSIPGTYHNILGLVRPAIQFDFPSQPQGAILEGAHLIPHRVLANAFDQNLQDERFVLKLKSATAARVWLLACPPPKQDNEFMMNHLLAKKSRSYRGLDVAASGLNRPELRRKLWLLECERLEAWGKSLDMGFVPAPVACFDEQGFLAERFYAQDATHANADYGLLMLERVASITNLDQGAA